MTRTKTRELHHGWGEGEATPRCTEDSAPPAKTIQSGKGANEVSASVEEYYQALITEAPYIPGDSGDDDVPIKEIEWLDHSLIKQSYNFHNRYFGGVILSSLGTLVLGFAVKPLTAVILSTGRLYDPERSYQRYLSTIQRILKFFMLPVDPVEGFKAFETVRKMHRLASKKKINVVQSETSDELGHVTESVSPEYKKEMAEAMRKDLDFIDSSAAPKHLLTWQPTLPVSQFDMVITQLGFVGTMWLFPGTFGIQSREELKGLIHHWALFGRLLGIKDKYNLCLQPDLKVIDKLFYSVIVDSLKNMDDTVVTIQEVFMTAFKKRFPFVNYKAFFYYGLREIDGYKGEHLWSIMSWRDKLSFGFLRVFMWPSKVSSVTRMIFNIWMAGFLHLQFWLYLPSGTVLSLGNYLSIIWHGRSE